MSITDQIMAARATLNRNGSIERLIERVPQADFESGMFTDLQRQVEESVQAYSRTNIGLMPIEYLALALYALLDTDQYTI